MLGFDFWQFLAGLRLTTDWGGSAYGFPPPGGDIWRGNYIDDLAQLTVMTPQAAAWEQGCQSPSPHVEAHVSSARAFWHQVVARETGA